MNLLKYISLALTFLWVPLTNSFVGATAIYFTCEEKRGFSGIHKASDHIVKSKHGDYIYIYYSRSSKGYHLARHTSKTRALAEVVLSTSCLIDLDGMISRHRPKRRGLVKNLKRNFKGHSIYSRLKGRESLKMKIFKKAVQYYPDFSLDKIRDIIGAKITTFNIEERTAVAEKLKKIYKDKILDFQLVSQKSGYRALHIDIELAPRIYAQVQVMTRCMSAWSAWEHSKIYKAKKKYSDEYVKRLNDFSISWSSKIYDYDHEIPVVKWPSAKDFGLSKKDAPKKIDCSTI